MPSTQTGPSPPFPGAPHLSHHIMCVHHKIVLERGRRDARVRYVHEQLVADCERFLDAAILVPAGEYTVLLAHVLHIPVRTANSTGVSGELACFSGQGQDAGVDEGLVPLRVDATDFGYNANGLVIEMNGAGRHLHQIVRDVVSFVMQVN